MGRYHTVHVFVSTGRFRSFEKMRAFVDMTYTEDGNGIPSPFMREVELSEYEPGCIEAVHRGKQVALTELLAGASYSDQWLPRLDRSWQADAAICVFSPNKVGRPENCSLDYVGEFEFKPVFDAEFQQ